MKISIGTKISSIFTAIILAMASAACLNLYATREVEANLDNITNGYLVAYGACARMNIRTLEQAYRVRRYVIEKTLSIKSQDGDIVATRARLALLSNQFHTELNHARTIIGGELDNTGSLADRALLGRIDERLAKIESEQFGFEKNLATILANFDAGDLSTFKLQFAALTVWRMDFDDYVEGTRLMMLSAAQQAGRQAETNQLRATFYGWTVLALSAILAIWVSVRLTRQLVRPIGNLLEGTRAIASGRLDLELPVTSSDEIGVLTAAFNRMTEDLRAGTRAREMFGKYVDTRVAKNLIDHPYMLGQEGERRVMTVLFCDLAGFTSMSVSMTPRGLVTVVNRYFTLMSEAVREHEGVIDKFIGDAVMAYWGPPFGSDEDQAVSAVLAAVAQQAGIRQLQAELPELINMKHGLPELSIRVGIATGEVVVGSIGSELMRNFTVMGDTVNLASRLESANKYYGTRVLLAEDTAARAAGVVETREIDRLVVKGQSQPLRVFDVLGTKNALNTAQIALRDSYAEGLAAYYAQDWVRARAAFGAALAAVPDDAPTVVMLGRIDVFEKNPPGPEWDGTWIMTAK